MDCPLLYFPAGLYQKPPDTKVCFMNGKGGATKQQTISIF